jgi:hypothetical protein
MHVGEASIMHASCGFDNRVSEDRVLDKHLRTKFDKHILRTHRREHLIYDQ